MRTPCLVLALLALPLAGPTASADNSGPTLAFEDSEVWFVHTILGVARLDAEACDPDGAMGTLEVGLAGSSATVHRANGAACVEGSHTLMRLDPGRYCGQAVARDASGAWTFRNEYLWSSILPFRADAVAGFPDLSAVEPPKGAVRYHFDLYVAPDGSVRRYVVATSDATQERTVLAFERAFPEPGDAHVSIDVDLALSNAWMVMQRGDERYFWSDFVRPAGTEWWQFVPAAMPAPAPDGPMGPRPVERVELTCGGITLYV